MVFLCSCGGLIWENRIHVCGSVRCSCGSIKFNGRGHCCGYTPNYSVPPTNWELYSGYRSSDEWMGSTTWGIRSPSLFNTKNQEKCILNTASSMEDIKNLKQTGSFQDYCKSFDSLLTKVILSEEYATTLFVEGLNSDIGGWVKCLRPKSLEEAYEKANNQVNFLAICDYYKNRKNAGDQILGNNETQFDDVVLEENGNDVLEEKGNDNKIVVMSESVNSESGIQEVVGSDELEIQKEIVNSGTDKVSADVKNDQESLDSDDLKKVKKECDSECAPKMFDEMLENVGGKINDGRVDNSKEYKKDNRLDEVHIDLGIDLCDDQYGGIVLNQETIVWKLKIISGRISIKDRNLECLVFAISSNVYEPEKILCVEEIEFNNQFQVLRVKGHLWHKWKSKLDLSTKVYPLPYEEFSKNMRYGIGVQLLVKLQRIPTKMEFFDLVGYYLATHDCLDLMSTYVNYYYSSTVSKVGVKTELLSFTYLPKAELAYLIGKEGRFSGPTSRELIDELEHSASIKNNSVLQIELVEYLESKSRKKRNVEIIWTDSELGSKAAAAAAQLGLKAASGLGSKAVVARAAGAAMIVLTAAATWSLFSFDSFD